MKYSWPSRSMLCALGSLPHLSRIDLCHLPIPRPTDRGELEALFGNDFDITHEMLNSAIVPLAAHLQDLDCIYVNVDYTVLHIPSGVRTLRQELKGMLSASPRLKELRNSGLLDEYDLRNLLELAPNGSASL